MDEEEAECGTAAAAAAGRRRAVAGDSLAAGDRAATPPPPPPPRDGIVDQLAVVVVASSGLRASDAASLASAGTSYHTPATQTITSTAQEAFEKCWAHSPLRAAARRLF